MLLDLLDLEDVRVKLAHKDHKVSKVKLESEAVMVHRDQMAQPDH